MKTKQKIIVLLLIISFFSAALIPPKKVQASSAVIAYGLFKAGVSFVAFSSFAQLFYVNGYHMQISDLVTAFADKHYNYANGVYIEKEGSINFLEKLSLYTSAVLSGNIDSIFTQSELNELKSYITEDYPTYIDPLLIQPDLTVNDSIQLFQWSEVNTEKKPSDHLMNKIIKVVYSNNPIHYFYIKTHIKSFSVIESVPTAEISLIFVNGEVLPFNLVNPYVRFYGSTPGVGFDIVNSFKIEGSNQVNTYIKRGMPYVYQEKNYQTSLGTYSTLENPFLYSYPNYYKLLNGLATSVDDLKNLMNIDEYLQKEILKMLEEKTEVNKENTAISPSINSDGTIYYPGTQDLPDDPVIPWNPGEAWYNNLIGLIANIPDLIINGITDIYDNTLTPAITTIKETVLDIPREISKITDLSQDITTEQIDFSKLRLDGITTKFPFSIPFDYVKLLKNFKRDPIPPDLKIKLNTHYFNIDHEISTSSMNKYIVFFRWFALTVFVYALMMITRKVIKW